MLYLAWGKSIMEDQTIIELFFARSERAVSELADKYGNLCHKISYDILHSREDAQECVNDTYLRVWDSIPPKRPNPLRIFVCRIVKNLSLDRYRYNRSEKRDSTLNLCYEELKECIPAGSGSAASSDVELKMVMEGFLDGLSAENRALFLRRYWFVESVKEIAADMGMTQNSVTVRLHRLRKKCRAYLEKEGVVL